jgi:UDP-glucose 4-epimerase
MNETPEFSAERYFCGRRVLVTGGLGFIGANLARRLVDLGAKVTVVDAMLAGTGANRANLDGYTGRLTVHEFDQAQAASLTPLVKDRELIFNLAGRISHVDSMRDPMGDLDANVRAQLSLLETCRQHAPGARIVYASTRQIYGRPLRLPVDEEHPLAPVDVNGIHKMAGEAYHSLYQRVHKLATVSLRFTNVFGPRMRVCDARQTFLGIWLRRVIEREPFEIWGGEQQRDLTYVDDAVDALLAAAAPAAPAVYNVGGCPPVRLRDLAQRLVDTAGQGTYEIKPFPAERAGIDIGDYFADDRRFRAATGWSPRVSLDAGLAMSVEYYRERLHAYV